MYIELSNEELSEITNYQISGVLPHEFKTKQSSYKFKAKSKLFTFDDQKVLYYQLY